MTSRPTRKRIWGKRITRTILCLLLGAVTTVGVAWACELAAGTSSLWMPTIRPDQEIETAPWPYPVAEHWGASAVTYESPASFGRTETRFVSQTVYGTQRVASTGWPLPALDAFESAGSGRLFEQRGLAIPRWMLRRNPNAWCLGVVSRWPGFLVDTWLYAMAWWPLLAAPGAARRLLRRRRRACSACGYDLCGLAAGESGAVVCPECGRREPA